jgi:hypothetical protein
VWPVDQLHVEELRAEPGTVGLDCAAVTLVRYALTEIGCEVTFVGCSVALVSKTIALVGNPGAFESCGE